MHDLLISALDETVVLLLREGMFIAECRILNRPKCWNMHAAVCIDHCQYTGVALIIRWKRVHVRADATQVTGVTDGVTGVTDWLKSGLELVVSSK